MVLKRSQKLQNQIAKKPINQLGQATVEMVLLLVLGVAVIFMIFKGLKETNYIGKLIGDPWVKVAGMVECGVWKPCGLGKKSKDHPGNRTLSYDTKGQ